MTRPASRPPSAGTLALYPGSVGKLGRSIREMLETIGLPEIDEALELVTAGEPRDGSAPPSRFLQLLLRRSDPALMHRPITSLMRDCGLTIFDMLDLLQKRNVALAIAASGRHLPDVLDDIGEDARTRLLTCNRCSGEGMLATATDLASDADLGEDAPDYPEETCPDCRGTGALRQLGDSDARKLLLGVHGLARAGGGGTVVNVQAQAQAGASANASGGPQNPTDLLSRMQRVVEGGGVSASRTSASSATVDVPPARNED